MEYRVDLLAHRIARRPLKITLNMPQTMLGMASAVSVSATTSFHRATIGPPHQYPLGSPQGSVCAQGAPPFWANAGNARSDICDPYGAEQRKACQLPFGQFSVIPRADPVRPVPSSR